VDVCSIRQVTFAGSHFERGLERGRRLRVTLRVPDLSTVPSTFVEACRAAAADVHPLAIEEFEGLVEGGGFDREALAAYYFARLESRLGGCTMFAVMPEGRDRGRGPLIGRNYDWAAADLRWCELQRYLPDRGLRRIGYTHHWAGCPDVLNEHGLYVAIASLPPESVVRPGVQWSILVEAVSEQCATVRDAVGLLSGVTHLRPMSYLLADASGDAAVVEATPRCVCLRQPEGGLVLAANAPLGGEPLPPPEPAGAALEQPLGPEPPSDAGRARARSERRVERARRMLLDAWPRVSEDTVRAVLRDHEAPICTGDHAREDGAPWATIWSGICEPAAGRFLIAPGLPCRQEYQEFSMAVGPGPS
jgi:hypothetical protein